MKHMALYALFKKYVPQDLVSKTDFCRVLNNVSIKKEEEPADLFKLISCIDNKYINATYQFPYKEKIATVLKNPPSEYSTVFRCDKCVKWSALNIEYLQEAMIHMYCTMYVNKINTDTDTYIGLASKYVSKVIWYQCKK